jgi:predicted transposase YdaD
MKRDDTLWKSILEDVFIDFLRFFYPNADEIFDLERGFEFLDKELEDISPQQNEEDIRYVDKLVKVWLKSGEEEWILIHVDVQGQPQKAFPERMYIYNYRIRDRYNRRVVAWAILTDKNKRFVPNQYKESYLGTSIAYQYNIYKVITQDEQLLRESNNPFAIVILTVLLALKKEKLGELELIDLKLELVKHLLQKEIPKKKIRALMNFLKHYVRFNDENTRIFERKLEQFTGKTYPMGIEQFLLQRAEDQGVKKGIEKGIEKGVDINKQEVIRNARVKEKLSIETIANIVALSPQRVRQILDKMGIE